MKELKPKIQLKYNEYIEAIVTLMEQLYLDANNKVLLDDPIERQAFDSRYFTFLFSSMTLFLENESKIGKKICTDIERDSVDEFLSKLTDNHATKISWINFYDDFSKVLKEVLKKSSSEISDAMQLVGLSKILLDGINVDKEEQVNFISLISVQIQNAMSAMLRLAKNTGLSPKLMGKPNFMILRD